VEAGAHIPLDRLTLSVGLLGVFRIANVDDRFWFGLGAAGRSLASYLFTYPGRPHRREHLADLFWPTLDQDRARSALNSAVWRVRKLLASNSKSAGERGLRTAGPEILLEHGDWLDVDAIALQDAANSVIKKPAMLADPAALDRLVAVLSRYEGPFLDGEDGDWILEERERLHSIFVRTAIQVVCQLGRERRYSDAIELARLALKFDPYREELFRLLLGLLTLNEQRANAIRQYDNWSKSLAKDLEIAPLPATCAFVKDIRAIHTDEEFQALRVRLFCS
jgi:DNA-binding SARP family transcriptional activator